MMDATYFAVILGLRDVLRRELGVECCEMHVGIHIFAGIEKNLLNLKGTFGVAEGGQRWLMFHGIKVYERLDYAPRDIALRNQ